MTLRPLSSCRRLTICLLTFAAVLTGCATPQSRMPQVQSGAALDEARKQQELVVESWLESHKRLQTVASRILISGTELCGEKVGPYFGITTWNIQTVNKAWTEAARSRYQLNDELKVATVAGQAETAGIKEGDRIISVNGWPVPPGKEAVTRFNERLNQEAKFGTINLELVRGSETIKADLKPVQACKFRVELDQKDQKNAFADGERIVIFKGMMDFAKNDDEIALVVSHELAHNSMNHMAAQKRNAALGGIVGLLLDVAAAAGGVNTNGNFTDLGAKMGAASFSVAFEQEADYVGLYHMVRAGYKIDDAANFWRRMAVADPTAITMKSTHPTTPERFLAIDTAVKEIKQKIADGQPLKPELKSQ